MNRLLSLMTVFLLGSVISSDAQDLLLTPPLRKTEISEESDSSGSIWDRLGVRKMTGLWTESIGRLQSVYSALRPRSWGKSDSPEISEEFQVQELDFDFASQSHSLKSESEMKIRVMHRLDSLDSASHPEVVDQFLLSLGDSSESVRYEALKVLQRHLAIDSLRTSDHGGTIQPQVSSLQPPASTIRDERSENQLATLNFREKILPRVEDLLLACDPDGSPKEKSSRILDLACAMLFEIPIEQDPPPQKLEPVELVEMENENQRSFPGLRWPIRRDSESFTGQDSPGWYRLPRIKNWLTPRWLSAVRNQQSAVSGQRTVVGQEYFGIGSQRATRRLDRTGSLNPDHKIPQQVRALSASRGRQGTGAGGSLLR